MKQELDTKKLTKAAVIPLKESDINLMKKRIDQINSKLQEKQKNMQKIFKEYQGFDINISVQQKLINLKTQMINHEQLNADIIMLIDSVLNNRSEDKQKRDSHGKILSVKKSTEPKDDHDVDEYENEDNYSGEQSEDKSQALSEDSKYLQSQKSNQIQCISQLKIKPSQVFYQKHKNVNSQNTFQSPNSTSGKLKASVVLPQSKQIKKQQPLSIENKDNQDQQKTHRIGPVTRQFLKAAGELNKKTNKNDHQAFQKYKKELQKASIDFNLDIPKYFLDEIQFQKRLDTQQFNIRSLRSKEDKLFVIKLVKSLMNNYARASQMLVFSKSIVRRLVEGNSKRRKIIWKNKYVFNKSNQEKDNRSQSSNEDDESENDEEQIDTDNKSRKIQDEEFIQITEELRMTDLEIKEEEEEFLRENQWLRNEGLLSTFQIKQEEEDTRGQLDQYCNSQQEIKIEE